MIAPMKDEQVVGLSPFLSRQEALELPLHPVRSCRIFRYETNPVGHPKNMSVHGQRGHVECHGGYDLCRFASDSGQPHQFIHRFRDQSIELVHQQVGRPDQML